MKAKRLQRQLAKMLSEPEEELVYLLDDRPGIRRLRSGKGFRYLSPSNRALAGRRQLARIRALAIPPAWREVWISPLPNSHLQATGRDQRGRKQYRYHEQWRRSRDEDKFARLASFARSLPALRRRLNADLRKRGLPREKVLAAVVLLLERTLVRVGNQEYARSNRSFGLTTIQDRHVKRSRRGLRLRFKGKSGVDHEIELNDPLLCRIISRCRDIPGQLLFQYYDERGARASVSSNDVNEYIRSVTGDGFTAKDFRTWGGSVLAVKELEKLVGSGARGAAKRSISEAVIQVARGLRNRPATCRSFYIHPRVLEYFADGRLNRIIRRLSRGSWRRSFRFYEKVALAIIGGR